MTNKQVIEALKKIREECKETDCSKCRHGFKRDVFILCRWRELGFCLEERSPDIWDIGVIERILNETD